MNNLQFKKNAKAGFRLNRNNIHENESKIDYRFQQKNRFNGRNIFHKIILLLSTITYNIIGILFGLYSILFCSEQKERINKIVFLGFGGIGNHLMLTPALKIIRNSSRDMNTHLVASSKACAQLLKDNDSIDSFSIMNIGHMRSIMNYIKAGLAIRSLKPDAVIAAAGTDPVAGALISFFSGAKLRIGEDWFGRGFLYTNKIDANLQISESKQNINLVKAIGYTGIETMPEIKLKANERNEGIKWRNSLNVAEGKKLIGIHPGSGKLQKWKRWDVEKFVEVANRLVKLEYFKIIFFLGPEEKLLFDKIKRADIRQAHILCEFESIKKTAAKIGCCDVFLSNDSGLRHIAVALGIRTVGIFGPTLREKNFLEDRKSRIIFKKSVLCSPCHYSSWWLSCGKERPCLNLISADDVVDTIKDITLFDFKN